MATTEERFRADDALAECVARVANGADIGVLVVRKIEKKPAQTRRAVLEIKA